MPAFGDGRISERIWERLEQDPDSACWYWLGRETPSGWPTHNQQTVWRLLYRRLVGPPPTQVDMLCDSPAKMCMNPYHRIGVKGGRIGSHTCTDCGRIHDPDGE